MTLQIYSIEENHTPIEFDVDLIDNSERMLDEVQNFTVSTIKDCGAMDTYEAIRAAFRFAAFELPTYEKIQRRSS